VFAQEPTVASSLDQAAADAIGWAIAPNAIDRPATALEFAERLESIV